MRKHRLLTKELLKKFEEVGTQSDTTDPIVVAKYFSPYSSVVWFATAYDPIRQKFFGYFHGSQSEWGTWFYSELQDLSLNNTGVIPAIERDCGFQPKKFSELELEN